MHKHTIAIPPALSVCPDCCQKCDDLSLLCFKCKMYIHLPCSQLPTYQLILYKNTRCQYLCQKCVREEYIQDNNEDIELITTLIKKIRLQSATHTSIIPPCLTNCETSILIDPPSDPPLSQQASAPNLTFIEDAESIHECSQMYGAQGPMRLTKSQKPFLNDPSHPGSPSAPTLSQIETGEIERAFAQPLVPLAPPECSGNSSHENTLHMSPIPRVFSFTPDNESFPPLGFSGPYPRHRCPPASPPQTPLHSLFSADSVSNPKRTRTSYRSATSTSTSPHLPRFSPQSSASLSPPSLSQTDGAGLRKKRNKICYFFQQHSCQFGREGDGCPFLHPTPCDKFSKFGPHDTNGCNLGESCDKYHHSLCASSVDRSECFNRKCRRIHLQGTRRYPSRLNENEANPTASNTINPTSQPIAHSCDQLAAESATIATSTSMLEATQSTLTDSLPKTQPHFLEDKLQKLQLQINPILEIMPWLLQLPAKFESLALQSLALHSNQKIL